MRVAVSGTHATGKSTLIAELRHLLPHYLALEEPYYALLEEGEVFGARPTAEDFELQLERSCSIVSEQRERDVFFDRCPADYLAYLVALEGRDAICSWLDRVVEVMRELDLVAYVPIEKPDRISLDSSEFPRLRRAVDTNLRQMLIEDSWGIGADAVTVEGNPAQRATKVVSALDDHRAASG